MCINIKRKRLVAAPVGLALALLLPAAAAAQQGGTVTTNETEEVAVQIQHPTPAPRGIVQQGAWTMTPQLGFGFGGNLENSPLSLGIGAAYNWTPRVSFEGELGHTRSARQGVLNPVNGSITTGSVNALYHFATANTAPYATVGLGFGHLNTDTSALTAINDASRTAMMLNFGGGVKTNPGDRTKLRVGMRYYNGSDLVPSFWRPYAGLTFVMGPVVQ